VVGIVTVVIACSSVACGSGSSTTEDGDGTPATTEYPSGESGMFVVDPVPEGWAIDRAYTQDKGSGVYYSRGGDEDGSFSVLTFDVDPADPQVAQMRDMMDRGGEGITKVSVDGHDASLMELTDDGRTYGDQIQWFVRPDLVVSVRAPWSSGLDVAALAADAHEVAEPTRAGLVRGTSGGGEAAPPVEALRGTVDGDEWVLSAVLPTDYPVHPVDVRRGCAELTFRGETATTCDGRFAPLDDGHQAVLGGVTFGFGVVADPTGQVQLLQPESTKGPAHPTEAVVLPAAPELTWFVTTFDDVCDRFGLTSRGQSFIVGVPPGYPHRNDCAS
jgi:hypothetical protein